MIAGGRSKGGDFKELREVVSERVKAIVAIGETKEQIKETLNGFTRILEAGGMDEAVRLASQAASAGDYVLLSPGCASFDMFKNYEERGRVFKKAVEKLKN